MVICAASTLKKDTNTEITWESSKHCIPYKIASSVWSHKGNQKMVFSGVLSITSIAWGCVPSASALCRCVEYNNLLCQFLKTLSVFFHSYSIILILGKYQFISTWQSVIYLKYYFFWKCINPMYLNKKEFSEYLSEFMIISPIILLNTIKSWKFTKHLFSSLVWLFSPLSQLFGLK